MIKDAEQFKQADKEFSARHEAKSDLEAYIQSVESTITSPDIGMKLKRGAKAQVDAAVGELSTFVANLLGGTRGVEVDWLVHRVIVGKYAKKYVSI